MAVATDKLLHLNAEELREMVQSLRQTMTFKQATIDKLTHENALLKRLKFAAQSERFSAVQRACWKRLWTRTCKPSAKR